MEEIIKKIQTMTDSQLQDVMAAIRQRYQDVYPEWDVLYLALHKDPTLRRQELMDAMQLLWGCTDSYLELLQENTQFPQ